MLIFCYISVFKDNIMFICNLVDKSLKSKTVDDAYWPVEILGLMGNDTTNEIIEAISKPSVDPVLYLAAGILNDRIFPGSSWKYIPSRKRHSVTDRTPFP